jgi:hypothetical protein
VLSTIKCRLRELRPDRQQEFGDFGSLGVLSGAETAGIRPAPEIPAE